MDKAIIHFIQNELLNSDHEISTDEGLLETGLVDSIGMMRLVAFVEGHFQVKVEPQELVIENFETVDAIVQFLSHKVNE